MSDIKFKFGKLAKNIHTAGRMDDFEVNSARINDPSGFLFKSKNQQITSREPDSDGGNINISIKQVGLLGVSLVVAYMLYGLMNLGFNGVSAAAGEWQTSTMYATVTGGTLTMLSASTSNSFSAVSVSFSSQSSTADLGAFRAQDARGTGVGWTVNLKGNDWKAGQDVMQLDYNGTGADGNLGKLCANPAAGNLYAETGSLSGVNKSAYGCFSAGVSAVGVALANNGFGNGTYWLTDMSLEQLFPSNPTPTTYTTTVTLTLQ